MAQEKATSQVTSRIIRKGGGRDDVSEETVNPLPPQDQYPTEDEPTPNYDGYPVGTTEGDASDPGEVGQLSPRLNRKSGDYEHDEIVFDKDAAADQRDKPKSPYAD